MATTFRINSDTIALGWVNRQRNSIVIPAGAEIVLHNALLEGNRLVDVVWEGRRLMMFTTDLRAFASRIT